MHGLGQGIMDAGRQVGPFVGRVARAGGDHLGGWDITWIVLGIILWAAVMTALVLSVIALVKHLKPAKKETAEKK